MSGGITAGTVLTYGAAAASALGAIKTLTADHSTPPLPAISKPTLMPEPDDAAAKAAKRKTLEGAASRRGRESTILSDPLSGGDLLGA